MTVDFDDSFRLTWQQEELLASQTLPAGGAIATGLLALPTNRIRSVTLWVIYTGASASGFPRLRLVSNVGNADFEQTAIDQTSLAATSDGRSKIDLAVTDLDGPAPGSGNTLRYWFRVRLPDGSNSVRLDVREQGDTANPGDIELRISGAEV